MRRAETADTTTSPPIDDTTEPMTVVGRQAIYDLRQSVVAHELLFRTLGSTTADVTDAGRATAEVLMAAFTDIGLDELVGDKLAFVNIPYRFLIDGFCSILPRDRVVLEILEDVPVDAPVIRAVTHLVASGFTVALDDFEFRPELEPLIELAGIIKVDVLAVTGADLVATVERLRRHDCRLLAEKVENRDDLPALRAMGFELFQGYGLDRPQLVHSTRARANRTVLLQVMTQLYQPDIEINEVVDVISHDPSLAYALLRIVNSAAMARVARISSLRHAVVMLGIDALRNWATMILMTRVTDGSSESLTPALVRAKLSERVATEAGVPAPIGFTLGLLSALPELMGEELTSLIERIPLEPEIEQALLHLDGPYGRVLAWVLAYEQGDERALADLGAPQILPTAFLESMAWANRISTAMHPGGDDR